MLSLTRQKEPNQKEFSIEDFAKATALAKEKRKKKEVITSEITTPEPAKDEPVVAPEPNKEQPKTTQATIYPGKENNLPYDIVVERLHFDNQEEEEQMEENFFVSGKEMRKEAYTELTGFLQHDVNIANAGHYETNTECVRLIRTHLKFPDETVYALEPTCGSGLAMETVCEGASVKAFGIELNENYARMAKEKPVFLQVLNADVLCGIRGTNQTFGFCFANPPYGKSEGKRIEVDFLRAIYRYCMIDAIVCWVVPRAIFGDLTHMRQLLRHYEVLDLYRFPSPEYEKFHQVVFFLKKKAKQKAKNLTQDETIHATLALLDNKTPDELPVLKEGNAEIEMPTGTLPKLFESIKLSPEEAIKPLVESVKTTSCLSSCIVSHASETILNPPISPKRDSKFLLLTTASIGSGIAGKVEDGTIHRMRGNLRRQTKTTHVEEEGKTYVVEREYSTTELVIIDATGDVIRLVPGRNGNAQE